LSPEKVKKGVEFYDWLADNCDLWNIRSVFISSFYLRFLYEINIWDFQILQCMSISIMESESMTLLQP
jgi:hypothetical protein